MAIKIDHMTVISIQRLKTGVKNKKCIGKNLMIIKKTVYTVKVHLLIFITVLIKDNVNTLFVQLN